MAMKIYRAAGNRWYTDAAGRTGGQQHRAAQAGTRRQSAWSARCALGAGTNGGARRCGFQLRARRAFAWHVGGSGVAGPVSSTPRHVRRCRPSRCARTACSANLDTDPVRAGRMLALAGTVNKQTAHGTAHEIAEPPSSRAFNYGRSLGQPSCAYFCSEALKTARHASAASASPEILTWSPRNNTNQRVGRPGPKAPPRRKSPVESQLRDGWVVDAESNRSRVLAPHASQN